MSEYFTPPADIIAGVRARSAKINDVIQSIEDAFDTLPTALVALKAEIIAARDGEVDLDTRISASTAEAAISAAEAAASAAAALVSELAAAASAASIDISLGDNVFTGQQTFKETKDTTYEITDGAAFEIDPANGNIQYVTLGDDRTPAATNFENGQIVEIGIDDGTDYTIDWDTTMSVLWLKEGGTASAPTLATTGFTWVSLEKIGGVIYGKEIGSP